VIDIEMLTRFGLALAAVIALIGLLALLARFRLGAAGVAALGKRRVSVLESTAIDGRTRLVLLRRDDREHLIAVHPGGVTTIESLPPPIREAKP
jgi:flagellar protein FliO/FliZ